VEEIRKKEDLWAADSEEILGFEGGFLRLEEDRGL
jgi:hypothetical protein